METTSHAPSIFNDVIGPVMRGPSSSHCAAALRIGRMARDLMDGQIERVLVRFDSGGSVAATHRSQGSDMGLCAGLLGWDATDPRMVGSVDALAAAGIELRIEIADLGDPHPNTYRLTLAGSGEEHEMVALSVGGGMVEVVAIDGAAASLAGDWCETLVWLEGERAVEAAAGLAARLRQAHPNAHVAVLPARRSTLVEVKDRTFMSALLETEMRREFAVARVRRVAPVLPVLSGSAEPLPFRTAAEMLAYSDFHDLAPWQLAARYEMARGGLTEEQVLQMMYRLVRVMEQAAARGLERTNYADRILGPQAAGFLERGRGGRLLDAGMLNWMIVYVASLMEAKSAMEVVVAAPTAGSCGGLPGALMGAAREMGFSDYEVTQAMLAAGVIGVFIASGATFAAEVAGCQAECGAGSAMAAAGLVSLAGGTAQQAVDAASLALQNVLGMICDPVANRVEVPCLGKNVLAAANALACANMALGGFRAVIPLDEVIVAMAQVGASLPAELRCTGRGGLSLTSTAQEIERKLAGG